MLLGMVGSYGAVNNLDLTRLTKNTSYIWKAYRIKVTNSILIVSDIKVSASYDTSTKKIKSPTGSLSNNKTIGMCAMTSYSTTISYINNGNTIHYIFNVNVKYNTSNSKTIKVTKDWTPIFSS